MKILGDYVFESKLRFSDVEYVELPVYGVDRSTGLTGTAKYQSKNLDKYKVIEDRMFAYNPMRLNIGSIAYKYDHIADGLVSPDYVVFKCNEEILDAEFLKYYITGPEWKHWTDAAGVGSVRIRIYFKELATMPFNPPPLAEQKAIAHILGTLDDKIELNRRMNETLEAMAQALFKSWFVDFDPVIDNALAAGNPIPEELAERAALRKKVIKEKGDATIIPHHSKFPATFTHTEELGWIPEGWEISKAEDLVTRHKVKQKFTKKNALADGSVPIFDQGAGLILGYSNEPADQDSSKENPKFIFGDHTCITHLSIKPFSVGPNVIPLSAKTYAPYWTFYAIKDLQDFQEYRRHWMEFSIKHVSLPSLKLAEIFDGQIRELRVSMESKDEISKTLTKLRDTLLPKLISGELRISDTEKLVKEVMV